MRSTFLVAVFVASGCFNPKLSDGGFACEPSDPKPCPDGMHCLPKGDIFVCTTAKYIPQPPADMAMPTDNGDMANQSGGGDLAMKPGDDLATTVQDMAMSGSCTLANVTINEVQTSTILSASDEFIELYNNCSGTVQLSGSIVYRSKTGTTDVVFVSSLSGKSIPARSWFLAAGNAYSGAATPDVTFISGMADANGGVALRDGGGTIVDSMGWGTGTNNGFQQGTPATNFNITMSRIPDGQNTHNNRTDFTDSNTSTPRAANKP